MPVFYECQRCTACCRWPGDVQVSEGEIRRLAVHQGVSEDEFIQRFTKLTRDRRGLSLVEKENGECIFLDGVQCSVQAVKPQQCRDFPNLWRFAGFDQKCHAKACFVALDDYVKRVVHATGRPAEYVRSHPHSN